MSFVENPENAWLFLNMSSSCGLGFVATKTLVHGGSHRP